MVSRARDGAPWRAHCDCEACDRVREASRTPAVRRRARSAAIRHGVSPLGLSGHLALYGYLDEAARSLGWAP